MGRSTRYNLRRRWEDLPRELTLAILTRLDVQDILARAQFVCRSWLHICKDPQMWRTIKHHIHIQASLYLRMCRRVIDYICGQLVDITIDGVGTDDLIRYIAYRLSQIGRIQIRHSWTISDKALSEAVTKLPLLEELELFRASFSAEPLEAVARCCPRFKTLKFNCIGGGMNRSLDSYWAQQYNRNALTIAKNLPGLRHLELVGNPLTDASLCAILDGCPNLESLNLLHCLNLRMLGDLRERCDKEINALRLPFEGAFEFDEELKGEYRVALIFRDLLMEYTGLFP